MTQQRSLPANPSGWTVDYRIIKFQAEFTHTTRQPLGRQTLPASPRKQIFWYPPQVAPNLLREFSQQPTATIIARRFFSCLALMHAGYVWVCIHHAHISADLRCQSVGYA